ncbi:MAG: AlpA family phage regulatory protein [Alphaproteobacteria bacterium]|nr:MAG: AlpA family phage regulatory protein [Alphaproteobacteria bacterium]
MREVKQRVGLSAATIYRRVNDGTCPRKVRLGRKSVTWYGSDIDRFIESPFDYQAEAD